MHLNVGLPPSPPSQAPLYGSSAPQQGAGEAAEHPIGVLIEKRVHRVSYKIVIIVLASVMAAVICVGVLCFMVLRWRGSPAAIEPVLAASTTQRSTTQRSALSGMLHWVNCCIPDSRMALNWPSFT